MPIFFFHRRIYRICSLKTKFLLPEFAELETEGSRPSPYVLLIRKSSGYENIVHRKTTNTNMILTGFHNHQILGKDER